jgi:hypothetical protein
MSDEDKPAETPTETVTEPAAETPKAEPTFTQAEVTRMMEKERAKGKRSGRAEARKEYEAKGNTPKEPATATPSSEPSDVDTRLAAMEAQLATERSDRQFSEALLLIPNANLNDARKRALRAIFDPEDPGAIVGAYADLFGDATEAAPAEAGTPAPGAPAVPAPAEPFNPGAPAPSPRELSTNPLKLSVADYERVRARGGRAGLEMVEEWRSTLPGGNPSMFRRKIPKG